MIAVVVVVVRRGVFGCAAVDAIAAAGAAEEKNEAMVAVCSGGVVEKGESGEGVAGAWLSEDEDGGSGRR